MNVKFEVADAGSDGADEFLVADVPLPGAVCAIAVLFSFPSVVEEHLELAWSKRSCRELVDLPSIFWLDSSFRDQALVSPARTCRRMQFIAYFGSLNRGRRQSHRGRQIP
jgi:hypothetical protein